MTTGSDGLCECRAPSVIVLDGYPFCDSCAKLVADYNAVRRSVLSRTPSIPIERDAQTPRAPLEATYQYHPLGEDEIRLVVLHPGPYAEDIQCTIIRAQLGNLPPFDAISYTWADENGNARPRSHIYCGRSRRSIPVTANCEAVLRRIRLPTLKRLVWIDAVCINQDFIQERNQQVRSMSSIYREASGVLVYLGDASEDSDMIFKFIGSIPTYLEPDAPSNPVNEVTRDHYVALRRLVSRRWFSRIWVLQEAAMARRGEWICGNQNAELACLSLMNLRRLGLAISTRSDGVLSLLEGSIFVGRSFWDLVQLSRYCDSADPRDRIFALRGLIKDLPPDDLVPDYAKSAAAVYTEAAMYLVRVYHSPNILFLRSGRNLDEAIPSWVPDFSCHEGEQLYIDVDPFGVAEPGLPFSSAIQECMATISPLTQGHQNPTLNVSAIPLGTILETRPDSGETFEHHPILSEEFHRHFWAEAKLSNTYMQEVVHVLARCLHDWALETRPSSPTTADLTFLSKLIPRFTRTWDSGRNLTTAPRLASCLHTPDAPPPPPTSPPDTSPSPLASALAEVRAAEPESARHLAQLLSTLPAPPAPAQGRQHGSLARRWDACSRAFVAATADRAWAASLRDGFGFCAAPSAARLPAVLACGAWAGGAPPDEDDCVLPVPEYVAGQLRRSCGRCAEQRAWFGGVLGERDGRGGLFCTGGSVGVGPEGCEAGDVVFSVLGASYLVVLRPFGGGYRYVGPCFLLETQPLEVCAREPEWSGEGWNVRFKGMRHCENTTESFEFLRISIY
ncbi:uncharacterized protein K452DRAFT_279995 [Neofusicoccum parvum]|uniref:Uncharacterized protein K452DRAFT_279995, partial n=1 Tax=Neofusicoccum parvum TaxID=310453 RepID=A0ACB5S5Y2_9PEZI|nr:uncharacterized protein K452DRAFT_279995 [Neofusicoccum parvum]